MMKKYGAFVKQKRKGALDNRWRYTLTFTYVSRLRLVSRFTETPFYYKSKPGLPKRLHTPLHFHPSPHVTSLPLES